MKNQTDIIHWATDYLASKGHSLEHSPEIVLQTPWSILIRFSTSAGNFYLKQTPPALFLEPQITQLLANELHASVPVVIAINDKHHCFLMRDAGLNLRAYLKTDFAPDLLVQAVKQYTTLQRSSENYVGALLELGVPDWRLDKLPTLYDQLINQASILKADTITDKELQTLHDLSSHVLEQCQLLSQFQIPQTLVQFDFHSNNVLIDPLSKLLTLIDLGEIVITHPFFTLHNFLNQTITHDGIKEQDQIYQKLQNTWFENWQNLATQNQLLEAFDLVKKLFPIYCALSNYRLLTSVDLQAFNNYYAKRPHRLAGFLREYIASQIS